MISATIHKRNIFMMFFLAILFLSQSVILAQTGTLKGRIFDKSTKEALIGANVVIKGTSLGGVADFDGNYTVHNVPAGKQPITVSYIGYRALSQEIDIKAGSTVTQDFYLESEAMVSQTIEITAQAEGQLTAINQQLSSNTITNVVSAEKIQQLPDENAATALSRLPGLSLMNGDQVVIRGIQAKQNVIMVNGIQLPSTDLNTRATNLGFISSNMLSGIEVTKVLTPDMDANAIGGVVNLRVREAPSNFHFDVLSQGAVNYSARSYDNYKFWASASNRFFNDKFGIFVQGNADRLDVGNEQGLAAYAISQDIGYGEAPYLMNTYALNSQQNITSTIGGSVIMDYKLPHGSIMFQNTLSKGIDDNAQNNTVENLQTNFITYGVNRNKFNRQLMVNALQADYNFGQIKAEFTLSHSFSDQKTDVRYGDPGDNTNFQSPNSAAPFGRDASGNPISYVNARYTMTPDDALKIKIDPTDYNTATISNWAIIRAQGFNQHIYNGQLDFTIPVAFVSDLSSVFKAGGKFVRTTRSNNLDEWYKRTGDENFYSAVKNFIPGKTLSNNSPLLFTDVRNNDYTRGKYFLDNTYDYNYAFDLGRLDDFYYQARPGWGTSVHQAGSVQNDFDGAEIFSAGYLMGTFSIGTQMTLIAGGRFEHYNMDYHATNFYVTHPVDGNGRLMDTLNTVNRNDDNFFPNVQLRYKFTEWADLRVAYSKSISRPDFQAILPNTFFSPGAGSQAGNPKLKPLVSTNYDAYLSLYNNELGLFTLGGFYKKMDNYFFSTTIYFQNLGLYNVTFPDSAFWIAQKTPLNPKGITPPNASEQVQTWINNPHPAYVKGLEADWQTNFWYLPKPFNSLVLNVNYTRAWSEMDYQQVRNIAQSYSYTDPVTGRTKFGTHYITTDTIRTARLLNQGDDIINVALGIDYKGFSGRISFNMQGNVITTVGARPETDQFTGNIYKWDFTLKQELPFKGLSVSLNGQNIFNNTFKTYQKFRRVDGGPIFDNLLLTQYSPRIFEFNLRYSL